MSLFLAGLQPAYDSNGNPINGATWNFYLSGTTTPTPVYSDKTLLSSLGSTITSAASGRFPIVFVNDAISIRAILKDAGGATLEDADPVNQNSATATGITFTQTGTGAVARSVGDKLTDNVSVKDFGVLGNGTDESTKVQAAYDAVASAGGGLLFFPKGSYKFTLNMTSRLVYLLGCGNHTLVTPPTATGVVFRSLFREAGWNRPVVQGFFLTGAGTLQGNGYQAGADIYQDNDEYDGIVKFRDMTFSNFDKCISRPFGDLGMFVENSTFGTSNFALWGRGVPAGTYLPSNDIMHGGCILSENNHYMDIKKAVFFIDSAVVDSGQVTFTNDIIETCPGNVLFVKNFLAAGPDPSIRFISVWQENNYTGGAVSVDGETAAAPQFAKISNCTPPVIFDDTPVGPTTLVASHVVTRDCALNLFSYTGDSASTVTHDRARSFTGKLQGKTSSISPPTGITGLSTPVFDMPLPRGLTKAWNSNVIYRADGSAVIAFSGTVGRSSVNGAANDAALPSATVSQDFTLNTSETEFNGSFTIPASKYIVQMHICKIISGGGTVSFGYFPTGFGGTYTFNNTNWKLFANITYNNGSAVATESISYSAATLASHVGIGGIAILAFDTLQEALDCVNSGLFPA